MSSLLRSTGSQLWHKASVGEDRNLQAHSYKAFELTFHYERFVSKIL